MSSTIWWVRRDLRLTDNQALQAALAHGHPIIPVFIIDPRLVNSSYMADKRLAFLYGGLHKLDKDLRDRGSRLIIRSGSPSIELAMLTEETGSSTIFAEADHSPYARNRDSDVMAVLPLKLVGSTAAHPPGSIMKADGSPYTLFTPFSKAWMSLPPFGSGSVLPSPDRIPSNVDIPSLPIPADPTGAEISLFIPGEAEAQARLQIFLQSGSHSRIYNYESGRNMLDIDGTSQLSPYMRFGMLSARQVVIRARQAVSEAPDERSRKSAEIWLNELIWRDFYIHILYHYPHVRKNNFRISAILWGNNPASFEAWCAGRTGYPVVDAAMRQLLETGWMHNRARMISASFLTKDLLIDWRWGERWFMQHLIDGDPAANNGGWQWTAGTGTDAAPYFRIFNPVSQSMKFDPHGSYIRRWIPELSNLPDEFIHQPWLMPSAEQKKSRCRIGIDYPQPIVDHSWARDRALGMYSKAKNLDLRHAK